MTELPRASVIVPVYNAQATLDRCVESLLALEYPADRVELIFVDNASTDATAEILRRRADTIRVLRESKRGAAAARNAGLRVAGGQVVAFTDADCVVEPGWLHNLVGALTGGRDRVAAGTIRATRPANRCELFGERIHDHRAAVESEPPYAITMNCGTYLSGPIRRELFDEDFRRGQDVDLSYRLFQNGCSFVLAADAVVYHHNERSLAGLFREGFQHGFYAVQLRKKHRALLHSLGHSVAGWRVHLSLASKMVEAVRRGDQPWCEVVFLLGKILGGVGGSIRFGSRW